MVLVAYIPPPGLSAPMVDEHIAAPIGRRLRAAANVVGVSSISSDDEVDFYVVGAVDSGAGRLADTARAAVAAAADVPPGGRLANVGFLNFESPVPNADAGTAPAYVVTLDPAKAAAAGVTVSAVDAVLAAARPVSADRLPKIRAAPVATSTGGHVPLGSVAAVTVERQPVSVRRDY
jgi:multidrug efflux pump subunit AcrB